MPIVKTAREAALWIWERELGEPYIWGGNGKWTDDDTKDDGYDCSGIIKWGLQGVGYLPPIPFDISANGLYLRFEDRLITNPSNYKPGQLMFWLSSDGSRMRHVEAIWNVFRDPNDLDKWIVITLGASGGGRGTKTVVAAKAADAAVKIHIPVQPWDAVVDPFDE